MKEIDLIIRNKILCYLNKLYIFLQCTGFSNDKKIFFWGVNYVTLMKKQHTALGSLSVNRLRYEGRVHKSPVLPC